MSNQFDLLLDELATAEEKRDRNDMRKSLKATLYDLGEIAEQQTDLLKAQRALAGDDQTRLREQVARGNALLKSLVAEGKLSAYDTARLQAGLHRLAQGLR